MAKHLFILTLVLLVFLLPATGHSQVAYEKKTGKLFVKAEGLPLTQLLAEVSAKTGIEIYIAPAADRPVFLDIKALPVEDAVKEMIKPLNNMFVYQGNTSAIKAVKIYAASPSEATVRLAPLGASAARPDQKLPPSQAELEARARQRWEQRAATRGMREDPERTKKREEREKKQAALKAEQDKRMAELQTDAMKRLEETRQQITHNHPGAAAPENPPPPSEREQ
jgi:hypothetical protein